MKSFLNFWNSGIVGKFAIIGGVCIFLCICCVGLIFLIPTPSKSTITPAKDNSTPISSAIKPTLVLGSTPIQATVTDAPPPTNTPNSTATPIQIATTLIVTETSTATNTPKQTNTPIPTNTPTFTSTPIPPTPTPKLAKITGSGDSVVNLENPYEISIVHIKGNSNKRYFSVTNYDKDGNQIDLLVNTTDSYDGIRPLDFNNGVHTARFEIKASGKWEIEILQLADARKLSVPGSIQGKGDEVIILTGAKPDLGKIKGNKTGRYFGITGYGKTSDLLVNTTDSYEGTVILNSDTLVLGIQAVGDWSIEISSK